MKTFTLTIVMLAIATFGFSQACPTVSAHSLVTTSEGAYISVSYDGDGAKHIEYFVYCDGNEIVHDCFDTHGAGTQASGIFNCTGTITYILIPGTGTCINGTTCGDTLRSPEGGPTPVVFSNFNAQRQVTNVSLNWQTQQEINLSRFEVQRAVGNNNYVTIGQVSGHGTTSNLQSYSFVDKSNTSKGVSFYRLKIVDADGKVSYTAIRAVKGNGLQPNFIVFPNPSFGSIKINITDLHEPTNIRVIDNSGRLVRNLTLTDKSSVEISNLAQGTYSIKVTGNVSGESAVRNVTIIR